MIKNMKYIYALSMGFLGMSLQAMDETPVVVAEERDMSPEAQQIREEILRLEMLSMALGFDEWRDAQVSIKRLKDQLKRKEYLGALLQPSPDAEATPAYDQVALEASMRDSQREAERSESLRTRDRYFDRMVLTTPVFFRETARTPLLTQARLNRYTHQAAPQDPDRASYDNVNVYLMSNASFAPRRAGTSPVIAPYSATPLLVPEEK